MSPTSSHLGEAVRPDGTLKDASEIKWAFDPDDSLPFPQASGDPSGDTSSTPAPAEAGLRRTTRTIRPARHFIEEDAKCASTTGAVMTTCDYDSDANFFAYYSPLPPLLFPLVLLPALVLFSSLPCSPFVLYLVLYHSLASTAWPMTHSDASGCATSLFQDFLLFSI